jgi:hypothetical protein
MSVQEPKRDHGDLERELVEAYKANFDREKRPDWAVRNKEHPEELIRPSVPFIGRNYSSARNKILVYASAENLTDYEEGGGAKKRLEGEDAWNRRRVTFDNDKWGSGFPDVHIRPVDNGFLTTAVAHLAEVYDLLPPSDSPSTLIERIAVDNLGKFTIATPIDQEPKKKLPNRDYAGDERKLAYSFPYIQDDLRVLQPDVVLLTGTSWKLEAVQKLFEDHSPEAKVVPIYQITPTVMNCNIKKQHSQSSIEKRRRKVSEPYRKWAEMVKPPGIYYFLEHVLTRANKVL